MADLAEVLEGALVQLPVFSVALAEVTAVMAEIIIAATMAVTDKAARPGPGEVAHYIQAAEPAEIHQRAPEVLDKVAVLVVADQAVQEVTPGEPPEVPTPEVAEVAEPEKASAVNPRGVVALAVPALY